MAIANFMTAPQVRTANATSGRTTPATQPRDGMLSTQVMPTQTQQTPQWNLSQWNPQQSNNQYGGQPSLPNTYKPPNPATQGGAEKSFFGADPNLFNPDAFKDNDAMTPNYISSVLPVAQFGQNNFQYRNDFNEAQRRWQAEFGATQGQNQFQQGLSARQQMSAEEQARLAQANWGQQFGHTRYMDIEGLGLQRQQMGNEFTMGMDQNRATRDVANTYAGANRYTADQQRWADMYGSDQQLRGQLGAAQYGMQGQLGAADLYSRGGVQEAQLGLQGTLGAANMGLQGQLGSAGMYSQAQRYQADQEMAAAKYQWDMQMRMNQAMMRNNLQVANTQAYGRSQAPNMQWARSWA
jgi:hypothetical protein